MQQRINAYILAGGRSSRMGRDKAMLTLGGKTLLARAVDTLKAVQSLEFAGAKAKVTVVGERMLLEGADRAIPDRNSGCGPLGGMEAALHDLVETQSSDWAFFIPVDMPFLSASLLDSLLSEWIIAAEAGARICYAVVDGTPQPLISLVHKSLQQHLVTALANGHFKVTPVLQSGGDDLASSGAEVIRSSDCIIRRNILSDNSFICESEDGDTAYESQIKKLWFTNVNTEEDFKKAETFLSSMGSVVS